MPQPTELRPTNLLQRWAATVATAKAHFQAHLARGGLVVDFPDRDLLPTRDVQRAAAQQTIQATSDLVLNSAPGGTGAAGRLARPKSSGRRIARPPVSQIARERRALPPAKRASLVEPGVAPALARREAARSAALIPEPRGTRGQGAWRSGMSGVLPPDRQAPAPPDANVGPYPQRVRTNAPQPHDPSGLLDIPGILAAKPHWEGGKGRPSPREQARAELAAFWSANKNTTDPDIRAVLDEIDVASRTPTRGPGLGLGGSWPSTMEPPAQRIGRDRYVAPTGADEEAPTRPSSRDTRSWLEDQATSARDRGDSRLDLQGRLAGNQYWPTKLQASEFERGGKRGAKINPLHYKWTAAGPEVTDATEGLRPDQLAEVPASGSWSGANRRGHSATFIGRNAAGERKLLLDARDASGPTFSTGPGHNWQNPVRDKSGKLSKGVYFGGADKDPGVRKALKAAQTSISKAVNTKQPLALALPKGLQSADRAQIEAALRAGHLRDLPTRLHEAALNAAGALTGSGTAMRGTDYMRRKYPVGVAERDQRGRLVYRLWNRPERAK